MKSYLIKTILLSFGVLLGMNPQSKLCAGISTIVDSKYGGRISMDEFNALGAHSAKFDAVKQIVAENGRKALPADGVVSNKDPEAGTITAHEYILIQKNNPELTPQDYGRVAELGLKPARILIDLLRKCKI